MTDDDHWFIPKSHGYGATPANWKGWAALGVFALVLFALSFAVLHLSGAPPGAERIGIWLAAVCVLTGGFVWRARR